MYLGELGGLSAHRQLIMLDIRGTGESALPQDLASCRCDRLVDDVEALREHLGLDRIDLLGHSAGANIAVQYAARYPERVGRLVLVTPSTRAVGVAIDGATRRETALLRKDEPWFPEAFAALEAIVSGNATADSWQAIAPFSYGNWDTAAQAHQAAEAYQQNPAVTEAFGADGAFEPEATRAALAAFGAPVLVVAGEFDLGAPCGRRGGGRRAVPGRDARRAAGRGALSVARRRGGIRRARRGVPRVRDRPRKRSAHRGR